MQYEKIMSMSAKDLLLWLTNNFSVTLPKSIVSVEDMETASELLIQLSGYFQYLTTLASYAKITTRQAKRELSKIEYEDMVDKKEIIQNMTDAVKQAYSAVSRAVTIHIENNQELKMNCSGQIRG